MIWGGENVATTRAIQRGKPVPTGDAGGAWPDRSTMVAHARKPTNQGRASPVGRYKSGGERRQESVWLGISEA